MFLVYLVSLKAEKRKVNRKQKVASMKTGMKVISTTLKLYKIINVFLPVDGIFEMIVEYLELPLWFHQMINKVNYDADKNYSCWDKYVQYDYIQHQKEKLEKEKKNKNKKVRVNFNVEIQLAHYQWDHYSQSRYESDTEDDYDEETDYSQNTGQNINQDDSGKEQKRYRDKLILVFSTPSSYKIITVRVFKGDHDNIVKYLKSKMSRFIPLLDVGN